MEQTHVAIALPMTWVDPRDGDLVLVGTYAQVDQVCHIPRDLDWIDSATR